MAAKDTNEGMTTQQARPETTNQQQTGTASGYQDAPQYNGPAGMSNTNNFLRRSGSFDRSETRSAEALEALDKARNKAVNAQGLKGDFELLRFSRDENRVGLSSILVCKVIKISGEVFAVVRTLLLKTDAVRLPPRPLTINNQRIEVPTHAQDVFNDVYWSRMETYLRNRVGNATMRVIDAGPMQIPSDFDFEDERMVMPILIESVNRCDDQIARLTGEEPFQISKVKRNDERVTARIDYTGEPTHDMVGNPIRADMVISMNRQNINQPVEDDFYEREESFSSLSCFVNLEYTPPVQAQVQAYGQQPETAQCTPAIIITQVAQADWINAQTPELYMLALSNAYRITAGLSWMRPLMPQVGRGKKGIDTRDIGAIGWLSPQINAKVDTKGDKFSDQDFAQLMFTTVHQNPVFQIDVNPVGENSGMENILIDAAFDSAVRQRATERLITAADNLTGGLFSKYFDRNKAVISPYTEVHMGYYFDEANERRDIRDLDTLAMLNLTAGNVNDFMDWYRTLCDTSIPAALRMQRREAMERNYLAKNLVITGRALRLTWGPEFLEALDKSTREAGLHVDMDNVTNVMGGQRFNGNTLINGYAVQGQAQLSYGQNAGSGNMGHPHAGTTMSGRVYTT